MSTGSEIINSQGFSTPDKHSTPVQGSVALNNRVLRYLLDHGWDIYVFLGEDFLVRYANEAVTECIGYMVEDFIGLRVDQIIHPDDIALMIATLQKVVLHTEASEHIIIRIRHAEGHWLWMQAHCTNLLSDPDVNAIIFTGRDITEQENLMQALSALESIVEALRQSESRYRLLAENVTDMISRHTPEGTYTFITPSCRDVLGYDPDELIGHSNFTLIHPDNHADINRGWEAIYEGPNVYTAAYRMLHKNGTYIWLESTTHLIRDQEDGTPIEIIAVTRDISARAAAEEKLKEALQKERELSELRSRFVSIASHEFRTPLAAILATADSLTMYRDKMDDQQIDKRVHKIRQQVHHLSDIIEEVLNAQAARARFNPLEDDLDALIRERVEEFASRVNNERRLQYKTSRSPLRCQFDRTLIKQVINNLLSNALKYSSDATTVFVELKQADEKVTLRVADSGIGMPAGDLKHISEPFHRATNVGEIPGTGLGLNITRQAVELHNGTFHIESEEGKGTTIEIMLPCRQDSEYD